ncbi:MAG: HEAT repeat domain-containing protein [Acidobacteriota bacterium]|nr:HEAT repeat domain-containing protein [Acidobacteriota bacterium]
MKTAPNYGKQAWSLLRDGAKENKTERRAAAIHALSLLRGESRAVKLSSGALTDDKTKVRAAACEALGELRATSAIPKLRLALDDKDISVVLAAAQALHKLSDPAGDEAYYSILTGERKGTKGLVAGQLDTLKDPKKMALLGFEEGIGFVPFAGIGYSAFKAIHTDDSSKVRAAAARMVARDPDVLTQNALVQAAVSDKSTLVRAAALASLSERGNPAVIAGIADAMADNNDTVRYTTAAVILHLNDLAAHKGKALK